jgi:Pyruvate/2-oxoacid:ferredoxin oxidoreductase delta subunit
MDLRKTIKIYEDLCTGCGNCTAACAERAVKLVDGKAKVISDMFRDGFGARLSVCPSGTLSTEEREAEEFNAEAGRAKEKTAEARNVETPVAICTIPISMNPREAPSGGMAPGQTQTDRGTTLNPPSETSLPQGF